ncbi:hypothetical protein [Ruminococcus sp. JE7B6]|uniref:hypothetical protein n=1 Tax=Ruminococcus sp. JE7B6 TaxID=3233380 RepID=UPI00389A5C07
MKRRFVKCAKGAVSLFLIVLLLPFTQIATILVSAQRYNSSIGLLDEVIDSSSLSTLSDYEGYIRERFGLFGVAQKTELSTNFNSYFDYNRSGLLEKAFSDKLAVNVTGDLPLNDDDILLAQIKEYNKLNAPINMLNDGLDLSELIKKFEKKFDLSNILDMANSGVDICNGALDFNESYEKLLKLSEKLDKLKSTYQDKYSEFNKAIGDIYEKRDEIAKLESKDNTLSDELTALKQKLESLNKEIEDNKDNNDKLKEIQKNIEELNKQIKDKEKEISDNKSENSKKNSEIKSLINTFNTKRDDYANSHTDLIVKLGEYKKEMKAALDNINALIKSTGDFVTSTEKSVSELNKVDAENDNKKIKKELESYESKEADERYYELVFQQSDNDDTIASNTINKGIADGFKSANTEISELCTEAEQAFDEKAIQGTIDTLTAQKSTVSSLTAESVKNKKDGSEYYTEINVVLNREQLKRLYDYFDGLSDKIGADLSDMWEGIKSFLESIFKVKLVYDPALCSKIDTNYFANQFGIKIDNPATNPVASFIQSVGNFVTGFVDLATGLASFNFVKAWNGIKKVFTSLYNLIKSLIEIPVQIVSNVVQYIKDPSKMLLPYYFTKTLPCRTDYKTGSNMTGASFSKIEYANYGDSGVNGLPVIESVVSLFNLVTGEKEANDKMFCGAELEYLLAGSESEIANQSTVFGMLYVIRLLLDIPGWSKAAELQALASGPHYGIIFAIYLLLEPFLDCVLLVNGSPVSILKDVPYLSVAGMTEFIPKIVSVVPTDSTSKAKMKDKFARIWKGTGEAMDDAEYSYDKETVVSEKDNTDKKNPLAKYGKDLLKLNYKEYLMLLMLLFSNHDSELKLFKNIIQMETQAYNTKNLKGDFDLRKSYTQINCTVTGSATPLLATAFSESIFKFKRQQCRGY